MVLTPFPSGWAFLNAALTRILARLPESVLTITKRGPFVAKNSWQRLKVAKRKYAGGACAGPAGDFKECTALEMPKFVGPRRSRRLWRRSEVQQHRESRRWRETCRLPDRAQPARFCA